MTERGLICAYLLDGQGGARRLNWEETAAWKPENGVLWMHLDRAEADSRDWLTGASGVDPIVTGALLENEARPRCTLSEEGALLILRGINHNTGADAEDMVSIRFWLTQHRIISIRRRHLTSIDEMRRRLEDRKGPRNAGDFIIEMVRLMLEHVEPVIGKIDFQMDKAEEAVIDNPTDELLPELSAIKRQTVLLRRYIAPQKDALYNLSVAELSWMNKQHKRRLKEHLDRIARFVEEIDTVRDRASISEEQINYEIREKVNRAIYILSIVTVIFMPMNLITGLYGMNVADIPAADYPYAFEVVTVFLALVGLLGLLIFKKARWI